MTSADVWAAYLPGKGVAERAGAIAPFRRRVREVVMKDGGGKNFVAEVLRAELNDA